MICLYAADTPAEEVYCCEALPAFEDERWEDARAAAARASALDPDLEVAETLQNLAFYRLQLAEVAAGVKAGTLDPDEWRPGRIVASRTTHNIGDEFGVGVHLGNLGGGWRMRTPALFRHFWISVESMQVAVCVNGGLRKDATWAYATLCGESLMYQFDGVDWAPAARTAVGVDTRINQFASVGVQGGAIHAGYSGHDVFGLVRAQVTVYVPWRNGSP